MDHFRLSGPPGLSTMPGWYKACEISKSEEQVHLQPLCCIWSSRCSFVDLLVEIKVGEV